MTKEILSVPEEHLKDVIYIIRLGIGGSVEGEVSKEVIYNLSKWCDEEEEYLKNSEIEEIE